MSTLFERLASTLTLGSLLDAVRELCGSYELIDHWQQGEFHHDVVLRVDGAGAAALPGPVLIVATNCNGGVKELLCFDRPPARWALWHRRCPRNGEFEGFCPEPLAAARTVHWFDPCELLTPEARSELRPECRQRERGGGWRQG
jgi:hypothetical protein